MDTITLEEVELQTRNCRLCPLCDGRTNIVFGTGNPHARVMFIGEAPGKNEDLQGEPFVGAAGKDLNRYLEIAGLSREDVYIANILKCRPPSNRDPRPEEIQACTPYLRNQTRAINPEVIVTLGNFATKFVLKTEQGITHLHGQLQQAGRFKVLPVYHPAAAIYDRTKREALEADFAALGELLFDPVAYINTPRWQESRYGLDRMKDLLERLGRPQDSLKFVHVAGTNGKGSICSYLSHVLHASGYKTGLFTSPYIKVFEERIQINGEVIPKQRLTEVTLKVRAVAEAMEDHPTEFELMCAVAFTYFAEEGCDIVVAEVGLGGRLDATNIIESPEVSVIARLGLDHTALLGDTIEAIAKEKAGIIKTGCPVVSYPQETGAAAVLQQVASEHDTEVTVPDFSQLVIGSARITDEGQALRTFSYRAHDYQTQLLGVYQSQNAATALEALMVLQNRGWKISQEAIDAGIQATTWPGRFEVMNTRPLVVVDGGHNPQGAQAMVDTLNEVLPGQKVIFIIGILADKSYEEMLQLVVPYGSHFVCVTPCNPRALEAADLAQAIQAIDPDANTSIAHDFEEAAHEAYRLSENCQPICAFGSLYSVGAVCQALEKARNTVY